MASMWHGLPAHGFEKYTGWEPVPQVCLATWMGEGRERESVEELLRVRPSAVPLMGLVRFGDEVLGREGRLVREVLDARCSR